MPFIRPFKGLRYNTEITGDISQIVAPPYDIVEIPTISFGL